MKVIGSLRKAKRTYFQTLIGQASNQSEVFKITKILLNSKADMLLPAANSDKELADQFSEFFGTKIKTIRDEIVPRFNSRNQPSLAVASSSLSKFELADEWEVTQVIKLMATKSCDLDPMPTWLLKNHLDILVPFITLIVNLSIQSSFCPICTEGSIGLSFVQKGIFGQECSEELPSGLLFTISFQGFGKGYC